MNIDLSVVVIARNESSRIKDCLESVKGWANEIIVVDDQSTDNTVEIAGEYTDKVFVRKMDIEGRHRNWAYAQAQNQWVLSLDADERLTPESRQEISRVLTSEPSAGAFTIPRKNFLGDYWLAWGGQYPSAQLKLFLKDKFKWEEVQVHPRAFLDGECEHLKEPMLHYTYRDFGDFLAKLNNQTTLEAKKWFKVYETDPKKANYKMNFIHAFWRYNDRFLRAYLRKQGWRDGFRGFMSAMLSGLYQMVAYAKYWELKRKAK